MAYKLG